MPRIRSRCVGRTPWRLIPAVIALVTAGPLAAGERGWLEFADGNRVSGELVELAPGVTGFRSDRFGTLPYPTADAAFVPEHPATPEAPAEPVAAAPVPAPPDDPAPARRHFLLPDTWSVAGAYSWKDENGRTATDLDLEISGKWQRDRDEITALFRSEYEYRDGKVNVSEQHGRLRWIRDIDRLWFLIGEGYLERDRLNAAGTRYEYILLQAAVGGGLRLRIADWFETRIAAQWNQLSIDILDSNLRGTPDVVSLFLQTRLTLSRQLSLSHVGRIYFWEQVDTGIESETELSYRITRQFSIGLRHLYWEQRPTLQSRYKEEFKLFTRFTY